ncbi:MAG: (Fe-S)-binding protein [Candidatus Neomarinimicrobiota bacterium]|nr:(Fe-S)-binding protein [Candidatus Neomarinimicrobiota bacterium]
MSDSNASLLREAFGPEEKRLLRECIHCGFCLPACPTYMTNGMEMDSPRGRLHLMQSVLEGRANQDSAFEKHMKLCLVCRACETACPSGVQFGHLMEVTRGALAETKQTGRLHRFLLGTVLPSHRWLSFLFRFTRFLQKLRLDKLSMLPPFSLLIPERLRKLQPSLMPVPPRRFGEAQDTYYSAMGKKRGTVLLFTGCVMDHLFPHVHAATVRLLIWNGYDVIIPANQTCCGALHAHAGESTMTANLADQNIAVLNKTESDYIVINSAGCGSHLKFYFNYFDSGVSTQVVDLSELLASIEIKSLEAVPAGVVAYDEPCHLLHGQGISAEPKGILKKIPGIDFVSLKDGDRCCGSAGSYSITETEMSLKLLDAKMDDIETIGAAIVVTANPGCQMQLNWGVKRRNLNVEVLHLAELLDRSYSANPQYPTEPFAKAD